MPDIEGCPHCRGAGFYTETCDIYPSQVYCSCVAGKALSLAESNTHGGLIMLLQVTDCTPMDTPIHH